MAMVQNRDVLCNKGSTAAPKILPAHCFVGFALVALVALVMESTKLVGRASEAGTLPDAIAKKHQGLFMFSIFGGIFSVSGLWFWKFRTFSSLYCSVLCFQSILDLDDFAHARDSRYCAKCCDVLEHVRQ